MSEEILVVERESDGGGVLEVTINRPEAKNAMTKSAAAAIGKAMDRLDASDHLSCAILTGAGGAFCAGMDLRGFLKGELPTDERGGFGGICMWTPNKPVIAAVDGPALAGGFELALACDLIVASADARFGVPEVKRGLVAAGGAAVKLPRLLPQPLAMEMLLTGDPIGARRAYDLGLVNVVTDGPAIEAARELAARIVANGPLALAATKAIARNSWIWPVDDFYPQQNPYVENIFNSEDAKEGARAFAEKRKPVWKGR